MAPPASADGASPAMAEDQSQSDAKRAKINAIWEELNAKEPLPIVKINNSNLQKVIKEKKSTKKVPGWMVNLGLVPARTSPANKPSQEPGGIAVKSNSTGITANEETNTDQVQNHEGSVENNGSVSATSSVTNKEVKDTSVTVEEGSVLIVRSESKSSQELKAAQALIRKSEMQASSSSGLDGLLQQISKKQKPNILDRSRKDWGTFKEEKGLEDELEAYKKSGDKYLDKVAFLQRADVREYEKERDARLALQSKQRSETVPLD